MKATITVTRTVRYSSIVEMSEEDFARLDAALDSDDREVSKAAEKELDEKVDSSDWVDEDFDSLDDFHRFKEDPTPEAAR